MFGSGERGLKRSLCAFEERVPSTVVHITCKSRQTKRHGKLKRPALIDDIWRGKKDLDVGVTQQSGSVELVQPEILFHTHTHTPMKEKCVNKNSFCSRNETGKDTKNKQPINSVVVKFQIHIIDSLTTQTDCIHNK